MPLRLDPVLAHALARGATLLTPNQRAARSIRYAFDDLQRAAGHLLWTPARVVPLEQWLALQWQERILAGQDTRVLLNRSQELVLWREIIVADSRAPETAPLRSPDALADLAARAWSLLCLHNGRTRLRDAALSTDSRAFERWARAFERRLTRSQFVTAAQLPGELEPTPADLVLVDFDSKTPAVASLFERLRSSGSPVEPLSTMLPAAVARLYPAEDDASELRAAAAWVQARRHADSQTRIAVVVPNLADRRASIERIFASILSPEGAPITASPAPRVYEFSLGRPLAELPIAITALDLLRWPRQALPLERISALLLSPWFTAGESSVAAFDAFELRGTTLFQPELSLEATIRIAERSPAHEALAPLLQRLRSLRKSARETRYTEPTPQSHTAWADAFRTLLDAAGWSAHAASDSLAFQQHRRFESALDELATLDFEGRLIAVSEALKALTGILGQTIFAPESHDAPVQIVGPLELGGVAFDALWFLGADDLAWPAPAGQSPLIPWQLQRDLGMRGADRIRDDAEALSLTHRIAHSAAEVVFSFARRAEEGERRPSPLLAALNLSPLSLEPTVAPPPAALTTIPDDIDLPQLPPGPVRGGAQVLQLQAACGFRAFAEKRLWSTPLDVREPGFDALERGNLVHTVMQAFWTELHSQSALLALPETARHTLLDQAIDTALAHSKARPETPWDDAYLRIQRQRLRDLLQPWLALEASRSSFTVQPPEQKKAVQLGPLNLHLRIDRIDETPAGGLIVLDYKTGAAAPAHWQGDRPDAPQLPLYAVLAQAEGHQLEGVAFALIRAGRDLGLKGFADDASILARPARMDAPSLAEQIEQWREILTHLAVAFASGDTRVAPKLYPKTCEHCHQRILCRLDPSTLDDLSEDELEHEGEAVHG